MSDMSTVKRGEQSSCRSSFTRLCSPVWRWSSCRSSFTRLCSPRLTVEFMSLIFYQTLFTQFDGGVHVAHLLPDSVHPVWRWSSCRSSFTRLCSPNLTVEFMSLIFYQTLFTPFDGGVHVAHLLPDSVHPVWRWSSCRSSFTRLCSPRLTVEFMSLIFYQTLFTPFDGGVHVAHLLPDSVHPVWRWSSCRSSFTRLCSPRLTVEFMSLIFYQTLFTPFDGGVHVAQSFTRLHRQTGWTESGTWTPPRQTGWTESGSSCRKRGEHLLPVKLNWFTWTPPSNGVTVEFMSTHLLSQTLFTDMSTVDGGVRCRLIFYQTLFTPFDGGVHVAHLLPDSVHPVWRWSSCRSSFTRLCSPRLTVEFMSLIFDQTLFTPFDGGVHVAHLLPDSVHPVWRWSSWSFTLFTQFDGGVHVVTLFTPSSCRSSFTRLCSPRLTVEFMSLIFYQTLFTPFDGGVHVAHLLADMISTVKRGEQSLLSDMNSTVKRGDGGVHVHRLNRVW